MAYPFFLSKLLVRSGVARLLPAVRKLLAGGGAYLNYYSDRVLAAPCAELLDLAAHLEVQGPDAVDLAQGEPRFDLAPSLSTKLPADRRGLPPAWGLPELRSAIADHLLEEHALDINPADEVLATSGAAGAFSIILDTFLNPGAKVVLFDPCSPLYTFLLRQRRARIRWVPTRMENGWTRFHLGPLIEHLRGARLLVVNSPANPTGGVIAPEDLEQLAWWADRFDVLLVSDEVFARYQYEGEKTSLGAFPKAQPRTLTIGSLSKGHALSAARVGWVAGCRHLVRPCTLTAVLQAALVPTICQHVALSALRQGRESFQPLWKEFKARRDYAFERLQAMGLVPAWPIGGFFFWVPVSALGLTGRAGADRLLREKNVLVWPGDPFGPSGKGHIRLSYATEEGRLRQGLARLAEFVAERTGSNTANEKSAA